MAQALTFVTTPDGHELRRDDEVLGRVGPATEPTARAEAGGAAWELAVEGERDVPGGTWQIVAREPGGGAPVARYFHGSIRGGRIRLPDERTASLRRELGVSAEWRFRLPDAAVAIRPGGEADEPALDLRFVPGSADVPALVLLLACWCVMSQEAVGPPRAHGGA